MPTEPEVLTKTKFADLVGVDRSRVSQWISEGKIDGDAIQGDGPKAMIVVDVAKAQLRERLDIGQRLGNGAATKLDGPEEGQIEGSVEGQIKLEKLRELQAKNRKALERERAEAGTYVKSADAKAATARAIGAVVTVFEGGLSDIAHRVASQFELPQRDVVHLLRQEFAKLRKTASDRFAAEAKQIAAVIEDPGDD